MEYEEMVAMNCVAVQEENTIHDEDFFKLISSSVFGTIENMENTAEQDTMYCTNTDPNLDETL
jgi:hypothetical protein